MRMNTSHHRGFSLTEVLIATVILALGLIGLGAVFPAVIVQQRNATDLSTALMIAQNADALLAERLESVATAFVDMPQPLADRLGWIRIHAKQIELSGEDLVYLESPNLAAHGAQGDLRVQEPVYNYVPPEIQSRLPSSAEVFDTQAVTIPYEGPLDRNDSRGIVVKVKVRDDEGEFQNYELLPTWDWPQGMPGRTNQQWGMFEHPRVPDQTEANNFINPAFPAPAQFRFLFTLEFGERIEDVRVDYVWLNPSLLHNLDRLYPQDEPSYVWDTLLRRNRDGQLQYAIFVNRFDLVSGDPELPFTPEIPSSYTDPDEGMIRRASGDIVMFEDRYYLDPDSDADEHLTAGVSILAEFSPTPVTLLRKRKAESRNIEGWELDGPVVDENGDIVERGQIDFWYAPVQIEGYDGSTWNLTPLLVYTNQIEF